MNHKITVSLIKFYNRNTNQLLKELLIGNDFDETIGNVELQLMEQNHFKGRVVDCIRWDIVDQLKYDINISGIQIVESRPLQTR